ncbi:hypothetical protein DHEL01_v207546 [Diaporthe helianthi]|uniref:Uncharacterized protein n=1 Tax=Diaporthe helianthi TaxID=158607 RepID=A0A2P5HUX0_DIAHE|nr:hypothetical protein DHEL01_v207546 [Diaporthe helianthi]
MYVPLRVDPRFWFKPRADLDSRLRPSPSVQAMKIVRGLTKKHLRFIAEHEQKLMQRMNPEDVYHVYTQLGLKPPGTGGDTGSESSDDNSETGRRGDVLPITVVCLRSHHHPSPTIRAEALETWKAMREESNSNQRRQAAPATSSSWEVQNDSSFSDAGSCTTEEIPFDDSFNSFTSASESSWGSDCDDGSIDDSAQWAFQGEDNWHNDADGENCSELFSEPPESDRWLTQVPTPPPSDTYRSPCSPVPSQSQPAPSTSDVDPIDSIESSVSGDPVLSASEELSQVLNEKKILGAFLDGIVKRIKDSRISKSEREAEKQAEDKEHRASRPERPKPRGEETQERGDPRRALRFCRSGVLSPEQAEHHILEKTRKAHFESHFQMTHQYEDKLGMVYAEPVATQGVPPENKYEWTTTQRKRRIRF